MPQPSITRAAGAGVRAALACCVALASMPATAMQWTGNAGVTSDYMWRGSSQSNSRPALQVGAKASVDSGVYASAWASNVHFAGVEARREMDIALGWAGAVGHDWSLDLQVQRYLYPRSATLQWSELNAVASWRDRAWLGAGHSGNAMATGKRGSYLHAGLRIPANAHLRFELGAARYFIDDLIGHYSHAWAGAVLMPAPHWEVRMTAHAADRAARQRFGASQAGSRLELATQLVF